MNKRSILPGAGRQLGWLCIAALLVTMAGCPPGGLGPGASFPVRDPAVLEDIGRQALARHGFEEIMSRAIDAGLVVKVSPAYAQIPDPTAIAATHFSLTEAAVWRGIATTVEIVTAESLVILGGLALVLTMEGDGLLAMSAPGNVADTAIMEEAQAIITAAGGTIEICEALARLMEAAKAAKDSRREQRIKATQKMRKCRPSRWD